MQDKQPWWGEDDPEGTSWKTGSLSTRERQEVYVEWLVTPKAERVPKTKKQLAEDLGVTPQTLRNYDRDPRVQREVTKRGRAIAKVAKALDVVEALYQRALHAESEAAANTAAKVFLDWTEKHVSEGGTPVEEMTDEELTQKLKEVLEAIEDR